MTVRLEGDRIYLEGRCPVEDAEMLLQSLQEKPLAVDLSRAGRLHTAVVQILMAARVEVIGEPIDAFARQYLRPLFQ